MLFYEISFAQHCVGKTTLLNTHLIYAKILNRPRTKPRVVSSKKSSASKLNCSSRTSAIMTWHCAWHPSSAPKWSLSTTSPPRTHPPQACLKRRAPAVNTTCPSGSTPSCVMPSTPRAISTCWRRAAKSSTVVSRSTTHGSPKTRSRRRTVEPAPKQPDREVPPKEPHSPS